MMHGRHPSLLMLLCRSLLRNSFLDCSSSLVKRRKRKHHLGGKSRSIQCTRWSCCCPNGDLYVADFYNQRVQQLNNKGGFLRQWGSTGKVGILSSQLNYPTDVAVSQDGRLFVARGYNDRVQVFSGSGEFITKWGGPLGLNIKGPFNGWFQTISSIEVDDNNFVYAADFYNSRLQKFTADETLSTCLAKQEQRVISLTV